MTRKSLDRRAWGLLFWFAPPLLVVGWRALARRACRAAVAVVAVQLAVAALAYSVIGDYLAMIEVSWNRLLLQSIAPIALLFAAAFGRTIVAARVPAIPTLSERG